VRNRQHHLSILFGVFTTVSVLLTPACASGTPSTPATEPATPTRAVVRTSAPFAFLTPLPSPRSTIASSPTRDDTTASPTLYTDPQQRFTLQIPDGYILTPVPPEQQVVVVALFKASEIDSLLNLQIQPLEPGVTLAQKMQVIQTAFAKFPGYKAITSQPVMTTLAGQPALSFEFLTMQNGTQYHAWSISTVRGDQFYTLSVLIPALTYDANIAQAKQSIDSFMFLG